MSLADYYDSSYPPELWETPTAPVAAARTAQAAPVPAATLTVAAGAPGTYSPELKAADRPRNVTELRERATPADTLPWQPGQYVLVGTTGKRAHWNGTDWQRDEAPPLAPDLQVSAPADRSTVPSGTVLEA